MAPSSSIPDYISDNELGASARPATLVTFQTSHHSKHKKVKRSSILSKQSGVDDHKHQQSNNYHPSNPFRKDPIDFYRLSENDPTLAQFAKDWNWYGSRDDIDAEKDWNRYGRSTDNEADRNRYGNKDDDEDTETYRNLYCKTHDNTDYVSPTRLRPRFSLDFTQQQAFVALTRAIMKQKFAITWDLPSGNLCPTVPSRIDYLLCANDIIPASVSKSQRIKVLDIGVGASCIYPLLGVSIFENWDFVGIDINPDSIAHSKELVKTNHLESRIEIRTASISEPPLHNIIQPHEAFHITICNPPFFDQEDSVEMARADDQHQNQKQEQEQDQDQDQNQETGGPVSHQKQRESKLCKPAFPSKHPKRAQTGVPLELQTVGGERRFIWDMIRASILLRHQIHYFTTLVGRKSDLLPLLKHLRDDLGLPTQMKIQDITSTCTIDDSSSFAHFPPSEKNLACVIVKELRPAQTARWILSWTFRGIDEIKVQGSPDENNPQRYCINISIAKFLCQMDVMGILDLIEMWALQKGLEVGRNDESQRLVLEWATIDTNRQQAKMEVWVMEKTSWAHSFELVLRRQSFERHAQKHFLSLVGNLESFLRDSLKV